MISTTLFTTFALFFAVFARADPAVLLTLTNVRLTVYYDNTVGPGGQGQCAVTHGWPAGWQDGVLKDSGSCGGKTIGGSGNNRMVALPGSLSPKQYCGKKVRVTDSEGKVLTVDGKDYFYVKDTLPSSDHGLDISAQALLEWGNGVCGVEPSKGAINMPTGFTVEVLDEMDPEGAPLNDFVIPDDQPAAGGETTTVAANAEAAPTSGGGGGGAVGGAECPCDKHGDKGCCNGVGAICDYISNVPQKLAFVPIDGLPCRTKREKFYA